LNRFGTNELFAHERAKEVEVKSRFTVNNFQKNFVCHINLSFDFRRLGV